MCWWSLHRPLLTDRLDSAIITPGHTLTVTINDKCRDYQEPCLVRGTVLCIPLPVKLWVDGTRRVLSRSRSWPGLRPGPLVRRRKTLSSTCSRLGVILVKGIAAFLPQSNTQGQLEYHNKAKNADGLHGGMQPGVFVRVESKLLSFPPLRGIVFGNYGDVSDTHYP